MNPEQSRYCKWSPGNYVTDASWEGAVGSEAKPGDLPVTKSWAYGRWAGFRTHKIKYRGRALLCLSESPALPGDFFMLEGRLQIGW